MSQTAGNRTISHNILTYLVHNSKINDFLNILLLVNKINSSFFIDINVIYDPANCRPINELRCFQIYFYMTGLNISTVIKNRE